MAAVEQSHPMFERIEALEEQPPYDRALMERLGVSGIHVGCGPNIRRRWLNTDRRVFADGDGGVSSPGRIVRAFSERYRERYFLSHDALDPYPIADGAFDVAYSEHFIEHIPRTAAVEWLREIRRLLEPGGFVRVSTPNLRRYIEGYLDPQGDFFDEHRQVLEHMPQFRAGGVPQTRGFMVNQIFRFFGHQWIYDLDEIRAVASEAGFEPDAITECSFQQGRLADVAKLDQSGHSDESLYVEIERS
jgi:predicted SAM-dependent methyltransferase